jgi:muramoyltetrapeptide carboxypeptidase
MSPLSRKGTARAALVGGNLSLIYGLTGTPSDLVTDGKILFLEDLDEYLYHLDRMMLNLKRSGKLSRLAGLIVGGMTNMKDNHVPFGKTAEEIIAEAVGEYDYPVCFNFPAGHVADNRALILGRETLLNVGNEVVFRQG